MYTAKAAMPAIGRQGFMHTFTRTYQVHEYVKHRVADGCVVEVRGEGWACIVRPKRRA